MCGFLCGIELQFTAVLLLKNHFINQYVTTFLLTFCFRVEKILRICDLQYYDLFTPCNYHSVTVMNYITKCKEFEF